MNYSKWLRKQLAEVESFAPEAFDEQAGEDLRLIVSEAERRAAMAGLPEAVAACKIRGGPIEPWIARKVLATCLAAIPATSRTVLTPPQVAEQLGVSRETVLGWIRAGQLRAANVGKRSRPRFKIDPDALAEFQAKRAPERPLTPLKIKQTTISTVKDYFSERASSRKRAKRGRS